MFAIETDHLCKIYGKSVAVRSLSLQVKEGEAFGFLGPNGAGKTTSIKMLLSLARPTSGTAKLLGKSLRDRSIRAKIGFLPEHFRFHSWLTAEEFLTVHGRLYGMEPETLAARREQLLELVGLSDFRKRQLSTFSKGMLQRIGLAQAMLNDPVILFLDEPTSGLDPVGRRLVRDIIQELRKKGTTVFLNSHLLSEVEVTCDRVAFIKHGEVVTTTDLKALVNGFTTVTIRARGITPEILSGLKQWSEVAASDENQMLLKVADESALPEISRFLINRGAAIYSIVPERTTLEDLFLRILGTDGGL